MVWALEIALQINSVTRTCHALLCVQRRKPKCESPEMGQAQEIVRLLLIFAIRLAHVVVCNIIII